MAKKTSEEKMDASPLLQVLILEDSPNDAKLAAKTLQRGGFKVQFEVTDVAEVFRERLEKSDYDLILADFNLPGWTAFDALEILNRSGKDIPLIVYTGTLGDEAAAECIKRGAADFILKDRPARLPTAVKRALEEKQLRRDRKRMEDAFNEERHMLITLMDTLPDVIYFKDRECRFLRINKALANQFRLADPAQAMGKTDFDFFTAEHAQEAHDDEIQIIQSGQSIVDKEEKETWPNGKVTWVLTTKMPLHDVSGKVIGTFGVSREITRRKLAEQARHQSEERYRTLFERNLAGVFITSWDGRILDCNQAMADIMGFASPQEAITTSVLDLWTVPEDRANFLKELSMTGRLNNYELHLRRKDGREVWLIGNITLPPQAVSGLQIIEGTLMDITKRKLAEADNARLAQIVNSSDNAIFSATPEGIIATWNGGAERMFGYSQEEIKGRHFSILIPEECRSDLPSTASQLLRGEPLLYSEKDHVRKDGSRFPAMLTLSPLKDKEGLVTGISVILRDKTEQKRAEEIVRQSEEKYRTLISNIPDVVWTLNSNIQFTFISRNIERMSGYSLEEINRGGSEIYLASLHSDDVLKVKQALQALFGEGRPYDVEVRARRKNGDWIWLHDRAITTYERDGIRYADGILSDITERKRAEEEILFKTALLEAQSETTIDGVLVVDPQDHVLMVNRRFIKMWNLPEEAVGIVDDRKLIRMVIPQLKDPEAFAARVRYLNAHPEEKSRDELELEDGRFFDRYSAPLPGPEGKFYGRIWYFRDITERRKSEAERMRLATAIEQSTEAVVITNLTGEIEYVNPAFTRITGYTREEALGRNPRILKSDRQDPMFYQKLWETILAGEPWHGELVNQRKDGTFYTEEMGIAPVRGPQGNVTHFIATKMDISERKNLEDQLQRAAKMEAVGRLAGGVAHDFNNLLTVINGYSEILRARLADDAKGNEYLDEISSAGERAAGLTRQLLAFSRRQVLTPQVLDLNVVVENIEKMLRRLIGEDIKLRTNLDPSLERVRADPGQVEQVLMNLAVNARDAMPYGGIITIETRNVLLDESYAQHHPTVKPGPHVMMAVSDSGSGMTPEVQAHIFEPFFTTKELGKGTGLGLATVYGIVKQSEGSIWLYSELGQGTVFKVYLPVVRETAADAEPVATPAESASGTETVLLIEDEEGVRSLVRVALASGGYTVLEAKDAESALAICRDHAGPIHLLLTDVVMPQMSGPAAAEKVAALRPGIGVLFMSGYTDDAIVHHGVLNQGIPFIQKPFSPVALRRKIREVLAGKPH